MLFAFSHSSGYHLQFDEVYFGHGMKGHQCSEKYRAVVSGIWILNSVDSASKGDQSWSVQCCFLEIQNKLNIIAT